MADTFLITTTTTTPATAKRNRPDDETETKKKLMTPSPQNIFTDPAAALASTRHEFGEHGGVNMSIEASATFTVMEPETLRRIFTGELGPDSDYYVYSRHFNPTVLNLSRLMASLEGTEAAYCTASGMSAISASILQLTKSGGHVVASRTLYGGTHALLQHFLPRTCNITTTFVEISDIESVDEAIIEGKTNVLYFESVSNPTLTVANIPELSRIAHKKGVTVVVDNTFTPMVISPVKLGADVVVHSISKFVSGGADIIADNMADLASELFKLAAEHKGDKPKKKTKRAKVGSSSTINLEETASGSPSQSSPVVSSKVAPGSRTKRQRDEAMATIVDLSEGDGGFVLPACLSNRSFFDNHPLQVPVSERNHVLGTSAAARQEQLTQDVAAVIRLAETALVLNEGGPTYEAEKLAAKNRKLEAEITLLENDLLDLRSKQENYFKNMEEARLTAEQLEKTNKVLEDLKVSSAEQRSKMLEEMAILQAKCAPLEDEKEETLKFVTRGDLVKEIRRLGGLMLASMVHGWKNAIAQLKIVNVEHGLITEGIHKLKKVENGQIVIPEKYREMALEEEKDEEEEDDDDDEEEDAEEEAVEEEKNPDGDKEGHDESH